MLAHLVASSNLGRSFPLLSVLSRNSYPPEAAEEEAEMRPTDNGNKVRRARRPDGYSRSERLFSLTNKEIMADLMYGRGSQNERRIGR